MAEDKLVENYMAYHRTVFEAGAIDKKTKELIALSVSCAIRCDYCIDAHSSKAKAAGATPQEMKEAIYVGATVCAGAALMYGKRTWSD
jgi:AhpD family alkylhydroperoxidase